MSRIEVLQGDCIEVLKTIADESIDAVVCDPPYGLGKPPPVADVLRAWLAGEPYHAKGGGFMGAKWDAFVPGPEAWRECLRVLKPGGHLLAFFGTRTYHLGATAVELAGFEVHNLIAWLYGQGFPKSRNVSKDIDKASGAKRPDAGPNPRAAQQTPKRGTTALGDFRGAPDRLTAPATPEAARWEGWGDGPQAGARAGGVRPQAVQGRYLSAGARHGHRGDQRRRVPDCIVGAHSKRGRITGFWCWAG